MKTSVNFDTKEFDTFTRKAELTENDMLDVEKPGALTIVNRQRTLVPVDTGATRASVMPDIQSASAIEVIDHIGPSTEYSPSIEFGVTSKPNYPIQPFVRPSARKKPVEKAISAAFTALIKRKHG
jgi:hypothetical protein